MNAHIDYRGMPIVKNNSGNYMIDYHVQNRHPILCFILRVLVKRVSKTALRSHLRCIVR